MNIILSNSVLDSIDTHVPDIEKNIPQWNRKYYHLLSGQEHYRLLMYLSTRYNGEILADIGTNRGASALALSYNPANMVWSVDITDCKEDANRPQSCIYAIGNILLDDGIFEQVLTAPLIMLDIDHEYHNEIQIYRKLMSRNWRGIMICDDIHLNDPMRRFWREIDSPKLDITKYGHNSGTGAIIMNDSVHFILE